MTQWSMPWGGTVTGDASYAPYDDDEWSDAWAILFSYDRTSQGVVYTTRSGYTGLLEVSSPSGSTVRVANGLAMVDGKLYLNTANVDEVVDVPATNSNYYRVVLKKDFSAQTVRIDIKEAAGNSDGGVSTAGSAPSVTQTDGTTWEISLATIAVDNTPTVTITDTREYVGLYIQTEHIADNAVTNAKMADDSVNTSEIVDDAVTNAKLAADAVDSDQIADGAIDTVHIDDEQVTAAKIDNRTRRVFLPVLAMQTGGVDQDYDPSSHSWIMTDGATYSAKTHWKVPSDYVSGLTISIVVHSLSAAGDIYGDTSFWYGGPGEAPDTHNDTVASSAVNLAVGDTVYELYETSLASAVIGDYIEGRFTREASNVSDTLNEDLAFLGFVAEYVADS